VVSFAHPQSDPVVRRLGLAEQPAGQALTQSPRRGTRGIVEPKGLHACIRLDRHYIGRLKIPRIALARSTFVSLEPGARPDPDARCSAQWACRPRLAERWPSTTRHDSLAGRVGSQDLDHDARITLASLQRARPSQPTANTRLDLGDDGRIGRERRRTDDGKSLRCTTTVQRTVPAAGDANPENEERQGDSESGVSQGVTSR
jgi:hypothetical protein